MTIYKMPPIEVWERYWSKNRYRMIKNYHCLLAKKSAYYVQVFDNDKGYTNGYYTTDNIDSIKHDNGYKVINCKWTADKWNSDPLEIYVLPDGTTRKEYYDKRTTSPIEYGYNKELIGVSVNDNWMYKHVTIGGSNTYSRYLTYDYKNKSLHINSNKGHYKYYNSSWHGSVSYVNSNTPIKKDNTIDELLTWFIDKLGHRQYKGFYDDIVNVLKGL